MKGLKVFMRSFAYFSLVCNLINNVIICHKINYENIEENPQINDQNIMEILNSSVLNNNMKKEKEKNILYDISYYIEYLKIINSLDNKYNDKFHKAILNIDTTKKKKEKKNIDLIYYSGKKYNNNIKDIKKQLHKSFYV
ncbi:conserved Plasmodium protein, unknown function [Plasmodium reichenowi]|uniref:Uncharacterized protein n=1 Tax=Plasmodium reichenowi TaxID=5854 RepID=A0A151LSD8_PLARE|nr:hypothetical protein PRSY57_0409100 [Plasmodium reichenowi]KYO02096.1 hypothetical protein PRSY57_0409100 [Plasmodium reichenowi]SOV76290.1 conserved Plasmodium protein, unknown function [Plasmodium reichenowi]